MSKKLGGSPHNGKTPVSLENNGERGMTGRKTKFWKDHKSHMSPIFSESAYSP